MDYLPILLLVFFSWAFIHSLISSQSLKSRCDKRWCCPAGPRPFPLIRNILELGSNPRQSLARFSKIFGPIMTLKPSSRTNIVISCPDMAEEVLKKKDQAFSSRTVLEEEKNLFVAHIDTMSSTVEWTIAELRESCKKGKALDIGEAAFTTVLNSLSYTSFYVDLDLFVGGTDTTSNTVEWTMAELMSNPEKLGKARKELQQILGKDAKLEESDISRFPYLQAVVKETLRLHPPVPFLLPRKSIEDAKIESFTVPKDAQILINVWAMGRDSSIWAGPDSFVPERFLESEIEFKGKDFRLIPFGAGRRLCPGLPLAKRTVHFILASLLHSFGWKLVDGLNPNDIDMGEKFEITLKKAQPLRAIPLKG